MEKRKKVVLKRRATEQIAAIAHYIAKKGSPQNSEKFFDELLGFAEEISAFPLKYPFCKARKFELRGYRCAIYRKDWVFAYSVTQEVVTVFQVVHTLTIRK